ncbi:MAG: hypothetical protein GY696_09500 [Gammaproteobacteria bacterium]|nr:hypothetical protein [Gammaproteobacteria bacterium]
MRQAAPASSGNRSSSSERKSSRDMAVMSHDIKEMQVRDSDSSDTDSEERPCSAIAYKRFKAAINPEHTGRMGPKATQILHSAVAYHRSQTGPKINDVEMSLTHDDLGSPSQSPNWRVERVMFPEGDVPEGIEGYNLDLGQVLDFLGEYGWSIINKDTNELGNISTTASLHRMGDLFYPLPRRYVTFDAKVADAVRKYCRFICPGTNERNNFDPNEHPHLWRVVGDEIQESPAPPSLKPFVLPSPASSNAESVPENNYHLIDTTSLQAKMAETLAAMDMLRQENGKLTSALTDMKTANVGLNQEVADLKGLATLPHGIPSSMGPSGTPIPSAVRSVSSASTASADLRHIATAAAESGMQTPPPTGKGRSVASLHDFLPLTQSRVSAPQQRGKSPTRDNNAQPHGSGTSHSGDGRSSAGQRSSTLTKPVKLRLGVATPVSTGPPRPASFRNSQMPTPEGAPYICKVYLFDSPTDGQVATADFARFPRDLMGRFEGPRRAYICRIQDDQKGVVQFPGQWNASSRGRTGLFRVSGTTEERVWKGLVACYSHLNNIRLDWQTAKGSNAVDDLARDLSTALDELCKLIQAGKFTPGPSKAMPWVPFY